MLNIKVKKIVSLFCSAALVFTSAAFLLPEKVYGAGTKIVTENEVWGHTTNTPEEFAGIYEFDNLVLTAGTHISSDKISHLVIKVNGTLTIEEGADIRVRNGFYPGAPASQIGSFNSGTLRNQGISKGVYSLYPNTFGRGGNGGNGGKGLSGSVLDYYGWGGGGGGGGYGGGLGGQGGYSGKNSGTGGSANGGWGGRGGPDSGNGGGAAGVGGDGKHGLHAGNGGSGGGGNGGYGGKGAWGEDYGYGIRIGGGGSGGGGGGYGGGVLTIIAEKIVINSSRPCFLVSGQKGGAGGNQSVGGDWGQNGQGGMLVVYSNNYSHNENQWKIASVPNYNFGQARPEFGGGHGVITGDPQKVFINGAEYGLESIPKEGITAAVTGIQFLQSTLSLSVGGRANIEAAVQPANAGNKNYRLINNAPDIVLLNNNVVVGLKKGTAEIIAVSDEGSFTAVCSVSVTDKDSPGSSDNAKVTKVALNKKSITLYPKNTYQLKATVFPANAANKKVTFKSSASSVASVSGKGKVTARKTGKAIITVTTSDGKKKAACTVKVGKKPSPGSSDNAKVTKVVLNKKSITLYPKNTYQLKATVSPANAANKKVTFKSSASSVVSVSGKGKVTARKTGKAIITVTTSDGKKKAACTVKVGKKPSLKFTKSRISVKVKKSLNLKNYISPISAQKSKIAWTSQNKKIAKVNSKGSVTGVKKGRTYIYAKRGSTKAKIQIIVK